LRRCDAAAAADEILAIVRTRQDAGSADPDLARLERHTRETLHWVGRVPESMADDPKFHEMILEEVSAENQAKARLH
jgi:hypothetical protein